MTQNANTNAAPLPLSDDGMIVITAMAANVVILARAAMVLGKEEVAVAAAAIAAAIEMAGQRVHPDIPIMVAVALAEDHPEIFSVEVVEQKDAP